MKNTENMVAYTIEPHIELIGNSELIINGLKGIGEYTDEKIKIDLGRYVITIYGDNLYINSFTKDGAIINGMIISIELNGND